MKKILIILTIIISIFILYKYTKKNKFKLLNNTIDNKIEINKYYIYGNHLNIEGTLNIENYKTIQLVLKSLKNEINYDLIIEDNSFKTSLNINDGIYLDEIPIDEYFILIKTTNNEETKYYNIENKTNNNLEYYTITKNKKNNKININYESYSNKKYMALYVKEEKLKENYYDIIIDPGHGGTDPGASYASHNEADITLNYAKKLKTSLENIGLKVKLTRETNETLNSYGQNSRTSKVYESKAKYVFSLHLNSCEDKIKSGGIEVYSPNKANLKFAKNIADNIVKYAKTNYSKNQSFKIQDGVYVRTFTQNDINESIETAKKNGFNPYPITTDTTYYFMIRETGGIATNAYVDGRNKNYEKNEYYNSIIGAESYLIELGFINNWPDLNNLIDNENGYIIGLTNAIKEELS